MSIVAWSQNIFRPLHEVAPPRFGSVLDLYKVISHLFRLPAKFGCCSMSYDVGVRWGHKNLGALRPRPIGMRRRNTPLPTRVNVKNLIAVGQTVRAYVLPISYRFRDRGWFRLKTHISQRSRLLNAPAEGSRWNFCIVTRALKLEWRPNQTVKMFDNMMFIRLDTIPQRGGETDGRTEMPYHIAASYWRAIKTRSSAYNKSGRRV